MAAAFDIAKALGAEAHQVMHLADLGRLGGSAITSAGMAIPNHSEGSAIPQTYVPARNTIMLSIALGWAEILEADKIVLGVSAIDYSHYPDCRPEYIQAYQAMATLATKRGVEGNPILIEAPLLHLSKADTIKLGLSLGLDYGMTVSCYRANHEGFACGECSSCVLRKKGFHDAQVPDPTRYQKAD